MPSSPAPYSCGDNKSFAFVSVRERWPHIITSAIDDVHRTIMAFTSDVDSKKIEEGKAIISSLTSLKYDMEHDRQLAPFEGPQLEKNEDLVDYNKELERIGPLSWLSAPWLYSECYMYRLISTYFTGTQHWRSFDVYHRQKTEAFKASKDGVIELAVRYKALSKQLDTPDISLDTLGLLFREFADISLWGNATDLSILQHMSLEDIKTLQGAEVRKKNEENILVNDLDKVWDTISPDVSDPYTQTRIDFVLDNAGFELFADIMFVLFLLDSNVANTVVLHPKNHPWFVSDVLPVDVLDMFNQLGDPSFFETKEHRSELDYLVEKLITFHSEGRLIIRTSPFWTTYHSFNQITSTGAGRKVWEDLKDSSLVIFKGDLNHRKLVQDLEWTRTTPFTEAIGELAQSGVRVLTLRTCKADVVVGLPEGAEEQLEKAWVEKGNANKLGWAYSGKWAVVQYSEGN